jgi:capsular exopolysaccharide synthesis family protein
MKTADRSRGSGVAHEPVVEERHLWDYARMLYKRRWIAIPAFLLVFTTMTLNALRETPYYRATTQLLVEKDAPTVATIDQMFEAQDGWSSDEFYQTQYRLLQSRTLARRTIDNLKLWDAPRLGNGPEPRARISPTAFLWGLVDSGIGVLKRPFDRSAAAAPATTPATPAPPTPDEGESPAQSGRISEFLGGLQILPIKNTRIVEIRYTSTDPAFAALAANALATAYMQQNMEFKFMTSKEASDFLAGRLAEQRKAVEDSERALQKFKEENGAVAIADGTSSIVIQRLTDLNGAMIKAKTERISKEALFNQLKAAQASGSLDALPAVIQNEYIQGLKNNLASAQRQQAQLAERYGDRHAEMIKAKSEVQSAEAKLAAEISKVVDSVSSEYRSALAQEQSLQGALNSQRSEALGQGKISVAYSVLQREADSNRQIYENLLQRTKETGISGERRATNVRVVDKAIVPGAPFSPNVRGEMTFAFVAGLVFAIGLAFGFEYLDNRIKTPQELKATLSVPFLGMVPMIVNDKQAMKNPLLNNGVPQNFAEAFKTVRTNVLFSSAEEGMRTLVVTSAGPGEGKSLVASNLSIAMAQAGQRVLLIDADMRRPRVHEIFGGDQEPGLSNVLAGNAKTSEAIHKSSVAGLWLMHAGHIPPNPAELLASRRYTDFIASLASHFDWVLLDTPPVMVVADSSILANQASGVVFVVGADNTSRQAARTAVEQLDTASAHVVGTVLNKVDIVRNPYYYSSYYRKDYARYYVSSSSRSQ